MGHKRCQREMTFDVCLGDVCLQRHIRLMPAANYAGNDFMDSRLRREPEARVVECRVLEWQGEVLMPLWAVAEFVGGPRMRPIWMARAVIDFCELRRR